MPAAAKPFASAASQASHPLPREGGRGDGSQFIGNGSGRSPVAIVGGGPTGMALALALRLHGLEAEIFEARERDAVRKDARVLALSEGARQILGWLGAWPAKAATAIRSIHVSQRSGFGRTLIRAEEQGVAALGWVVAASEVVAALDKALSRAGIPYRERTKVGAGDTANFALTAYAEGMVDAEAARRRDYGQHAVLCNVETAEPHHNVAWERFTDEGPLALLPLGDRYSVVLTCKDEILEWVRALDDEEFLALLQRRFGTRHRFLTATARVAYPLGLRYRPHPVGARQVWLGNAAQTLHPVAGQGFNLALRDIWELATSLCGADDPGAPELLAAYARGRVADRSGAIGFTDLLIHGFGNEFGPLRTLRGAGLLAMDILPPLRGFVARRMIFGARAWP